MSFEKEKRWPLLRCLRSASRRPAVLVLMSIIMFYMATLPMANAQTRVNVLTLNLGENTLTLAVIDTVNGFAYFGTYTAPGMIVKVRLSDFTRVGALTLNLGENSLASAVIDVANGFAYFGTATAPGRVVKVRLSDFTRVNALTLNPGEDYLTSAVIDTVNGFAYFGTETVPGIVVKVGIERLPVGGVLTPVNKLAILAPYLALIGLVGAVTGAVAVTRRRKP